MRRRRQIRIAHPKIDDVFTPVARRHFQAVNNAEHVRRQSFDPLKLHCFYLRLSETTMLTAFYKLSSPYLQLRRESDAFAVMPNQINAIIVLVEANSCGCSLIPPRPTTDAGPNDAVISLSSPPLPRF